MIKTVYKGKEEHFRSQICSLLIKITDNFAVTENQQETPFYLIIDPAAPC